MGEGEKRSEGKLYKQSFQLWSFPCNCRLRRRGEFFGERRRYDTTTLKRLETS
jgi:hypothetical protein